MTRRLPPIIIVSLALAVPASSASADCPGTDTRPGGDAAAYSAAFLCALNQERIKHGLPRLASKAPLIRSATGHSESMRSRISNVRKRGT